MFKNKELEERIKNLENEIDDMKKVLEETIEIVNQLTETPKYFGGK